LYVLESGDAELRQVAFSADSSLVAASSEDGKLYLWSTADGGLVREIQAHEKGVNSLAFSPKGEVLVSGSDDQTIAIWRIEDGSLVKSIDETFLGRVLEVVFSPDGRLLGVSGQYCYAEIRHTNSWIFWRTIVQPSCVFRQGGGATYFSLAFSPEGSLIASGEGRSCCGGSIQLWEVEDYLPPRLVRGFDLVVRDLAYSPDGSHLAAALVGEPFFWLIDLEHPLKPQVLKGHGHRVNGLAFSPDASVLASASMDSTVVLWDTKTGETLVKLKAGVDGLNGIAFSPNGALLAACGKDGTVHVWSAAQAP
jgi:sugar lactone lactonase YvrE